jgi:Uma2 family endonuclease
MATVGDDIEQRMAVPIEQRFVVRAVDWPTYRAVTDALGERRLRLAYDGENLEIMTVSRLHDKLSRLLGRLLAALTEELDVPFDSAGSTTLEREDLARALEPDECYYLGNEAAVRNKEEIDLSVDPPPDLAVEIDISRSSLNRMGIYANLGVPEVWRYDGEVLRVYRLTPDRTYVTVERSQHFPFLPLPEVVGFLRRWGEMDETRLIKSFRAWVREQISRGWQAPG